MVCSVSLGRALSILRCIHNGVCEPYLQQCWLSALLLEAAECAAASLQSLADFSTVLIRIPACQHSPVVVLQFLVLFPLSKKLLRARALSAWCGILVLRPGETCFKECLSEHCITVLWGVMCKSFTADTQLIEHCTKPLCNLLECSGNRGYWT